MCTNHVRFMVVAASAGDTAGITTVGSLHA